MGLTPQEHAALRQRRWSMFGGAVLLVAVVVALAVASGAVGGGDDTKLTKDRFGVRGGAETRALLRGVPQTGTLLGRPDAPATITVFADVKCPICRKHFVGGDQRKLVDDLVRTGRANMRLELIGLKSFRPDTLVGRSAVYDLAAKDRAWELLQMLYANQGQEDDRWVTPAAIARIARSTPGVGTGLAPPATPTTESRALSAASDALQDRLGVNGTPTYYVTSRGATPTAGDKVDIGRFDDADDKIEDAVKGRASR